jgi:hypothetical protein
MPSLSTTDRQSLCRFTFSDGRQCRAPLAASSSSSEDAPSGFCHYHARKEAQSQAIESLAQDLSFFFSGAYLTANDLSTALGRLLPAVVRGHIKPRTARTIAYMAQTLLQTMRLSQLEYAAAFGDDAWRKAVRKAVTENFTHRLPVDNAPASNPQPVGASSTHSPAARHQSDLHVAPGFNPASSVLTEVQPNSHHPTPTGADSPAAQHKSPPPATALQASLAPTPSAGTPAPAASSQTTPPPSPTRKPRPESPHRDPYAAQFEHCRIFQDGKPLDGLPL